jgi:MYXO-CTERM domain-containing protein
LVVMATGVSRPALAYVRYQTSNGVPFAWKKSCVWLTAFPADLPLMTRDQTRDAIAAAAAAWSKQDPSVGACSYLDLRLLEAAATETFPPGGNDGANRIGFRRDTWCPRPSSCYDPAALALTSVTARTSTGELVDADIEINAVTFSWADVTRNAPTGTEQDLQNALTHEMGHVIGLDHTCNSGGGVPANDQNGNPIPDCATAPAAVVDTTMLPSANPLDTSKRTLAADDRMGVCAIYPVASDPMSCPAPTPPDAGTDAGSDAEPPTPDAQAADAGSTSISKAGCGCEVSGATRPASGILVAAIVLVAVRRRKAGK